MNDQPGMELSQHSIPDKEDSPLPSTSQDFDDDIVLPDSLPVTSSYNGDSGTGGGSDKEREREKEKNKKKDQKSRKELEEEEREKMQ